MNWSGPTYTDSGGFQAFSLGAAFGKNVSKLAQVKEKIIDEDTEEPIIRLADVDDDGNAASKPAKPSAAKSDAPAAAPSANAAKEAREWALWAIPKIKTMDKAKLDAFIAKNAPNIASLEGLDKQAHTELKKAIDDRLVELF